MYTSMFMRDARMTVESCLRCYRHISVVNISDGVKIEGALPMQIAEYLLSLNGSKKLNTLSETEIFRWWMSMPRYTPQRFLSSWKSRRPRPEIASLISKLKALFSSSDQWSPVLIYNLNQLMSLDEPPSVQFPRRVLRSTMLKLAIGVNRQLIVMGAEPEKAKVFEKSARHIISDLLDPFESELYSLCDALEALPTHEYVTTLAKKEDQLWNL